MSSLKDLILDAKYEDIDEATTTGNVAGYGTPFAFGDDSEESKKKKKKNATTSTGYEIVENINLIKEEAWRLSGRDEKYIDFQKKVDEQPLKTIQNTNIRNFISSVPHQHSHLIKFHNWETAMVELTKEIKRRKPND